MRRIVGFLWVVSVSGAGCFKVDTPRFDEGSVDADPNGIDAMVDGGTTGCTFRGGGGGVHESDECPDEAPICDVDDTCRPCAAHDECDSGVCYVDGPQNDLSCVPAALIAYVDATAFAGNTECTPTEQCRTIEAGNDTNRPYVLVAPGIYRENLVFSHSTSGTRTMIAYGAELQATSPSATALTLSSNGGNQFAIEGLSISDGGPGIRALGMVQAILYRVAVVDNVGEGIEINAGSTFSIHKSFILRNEGGGVRVLPVGSLVLTNTVVKDNGGPGSSFGGVQIDQASAQIHHATIVGNNCEAACEATGILYIEGPATPEVLSTIVYGNDTSNGHLDANQIGGIPNYHYSLVGNPVAGTSNVSSDPGFKADGIHLAAPSSIAVNMGCPMERGEWCTARVVVDDIDQQSRDLGMPDIGADECVPDPTNQSCE